MSPLLTHCCRLLLAWDGSLQPRTAEAGAPAPHTWQQILAWRGIWAAHLSLCNVTQIEVNALSTFMLVWILYATSNTTSSYSHSFRKVTWLCEHKPGGWVRFLKLVAPASFPGILLTLSSSVYWRLLPPADLSGCSKQAMVPHLHSPSPGQPRKSIRCVCSRVAEVGRHSGVERELVGSASHGFPGEIRGCQKGWEDHQQTPRHAWVFW